MLEIDIEKINRINYRSCLTALARPGSIGSVVPLFNSCLQAIAILLLYTEVSYYYEGEQDFQMVSALTNARKDSLDSADYLFFDAPDAELLQHAKTGTAESPEHSASLVFWCDDVTTGTLVSLTGPGIDGTITTRIPVDQEFIDSFLRINNDFPTGIDLIFVDSGNRILGLPRTTKITVLA